MITAAYIDELYYTDVISTVGDKTKGLTGAELATLLGNAKTKQIPNVHGETFQYEEAEATTTKYKNQLTGEDYREDVVPRDIKINFTIGEYDYQTKADLQGGTATDKSWERGKFKPIRKCIIGKTKEMVCISYFQKPL